MSQRRARILLGLIAVAAMAVSAYWAFLVPMLEVPDEDIHLDYAWCVAASGRLLQVAEKPVVERRPDASLIPVTHPDLWLLSTRTNFDGVHLHPASRIPPGYGSSAFFAKLNREASGLKASAARNPYILAEYPFGWYAALAAWLRLVNTFDSRLVTLFFAARMSSVLLLGFRVLAVFGILRELRVSKGRSLMLTAAVAFFPLTIAVSSSAHPENLSAALTLASIWGALVARREIRSSTRRLPWIWTGLALGALLVTKYHFFAATFGAVAVMIAVEVALLPKGERRWGFRLGSLLLPCVVLAGVQLWVDWNGFTNLTADMQPRQTAQLWRSAGPVRYVGAAVSSALHQIYGGGTCFQTFWGGGGTAGIYGWMDTPIVVGAPRFDVLFWQALKVGCWVVLALSLISAARLFARLRRVFRAGRRRRVVSLTVSNPLVSALVLYTAFYLALYVVTLDGMDTVGRHWYPYLLPVLWLGAFYAPKALRCGALRTAISTGLLAVLLLYSLVLVPFGERSVRRRFYGEARGFLPVSSDRVSGVTLGAPRILHSGPLEP